MERFPRGVHVAFAHLDGARRLQRRKHAGAAHQSRREPGRAPHRAPAAPRAGSRRRWARSARAAPAGAVPPHGEGSSTWASPPDLRHGVVQRSRHAAAQRQGAQPGRAPGPLRARRCRRAGGVRSRGLPINPMGDVGGRADRTAATRSAIRSGPARAIRRDAAPATAASSTRRCPSRPRKIRTLRQQITSWRPAAAAGGGEIFPAEAQRWPAARRRPRSVPVRRFHSASPAGPPGWPPTPRRRDRHPPPRSQGLGIHIRREDPDRRRGGHPPERARMAVQQHRERPGLLPRGAAHAPRRQASAGAQALGRAGRSAAESRCRGCGRTPSPGRRASAAADPLPPAHPRAGRRSRSGRPTPRARMRTSMRRSRQDSLYHSKPPAPRRVSCRSTSLNPKSASRSSHHPQRLEIGPGQLVPGIERQGALPALRARARYPARGTPGCPSLK